VILLALLMSSELHAQTGVWKASPLPAPPGASYSLIDFADSANGIVFSTDGHYVLTSDGGTTWSQIRTLPDSLSIVQMRLYDANTCVALGQDGRVSLGNVFLLRTSDRGTSWKLLNLPAHIRIPGCVSIATRAIMACQADSGGILGSTDLGSTWDTLAQSEGRSRGEIGVMKNGRIFVWSPVGGMLNDGCLLTSADSGRNWVPVVSQTDMSYSSGKIYNENLASFALGYGDEFILEVCALYNGSRDSVVFPSSGRRNGYWVDWGAFYDDGTILLLRWGDALIKSSGAPSDSTYLVQSGGLGPHVSSLATISPQYAWILSDSNIVFRRVDLVTAAAPANAPPGEFRLFQNFPNPFNPATTIRYAIPRRAHVTLSVYTTLGQLVTTLVDRVEEAGAHSVKFDGTSLSSGVYFYRLQAGNYTNTMKMTVLR